VLANRHKIQCDIREEIVKDESRECEQTRSSQQQDDSSSTTWTRTTDRLEFGFELWKDCREQILVVSLPSDDGEREDSCNMGERMEQGGEEDEVPVLSGITSLVL
jgi:hypothetical protein